VSDAINHVGSVVKHHHGFTRRDGDAGARGVLHRDGVGAGVVDEVEFFDGRDDEVPSTGSGADQVEPQVSRGLGRVGVRQADGYVAAGKSNICGASDGFLKGRTKVGVGNSTPRVVFLPRSHKLDFKGAVRASHLRFLLEAYAFSRVYH
jgi:hypothetical protein